MSEWNGTLWLGLLPFVDDLSLPQSSPALPRTGAVWAQNWSTNNNTPFVDLRTCCGPDGTELVFTFDEGHLNAKGLNLVGHALYQHVKTELGLP